MIGLCSRFAVVASEARSIRYMSLFPELVAGPTVPVSCMDGEPSVATIAKRDTSNV